MKILTSTPEVDFVPLFIEPLDTIEIGAWPAKADGILERQLKNGGSFFATVL
jgi:hypothetical protein